MAKTIDDLSTEIADFKKALEEGKSEVTYKVPNQDDTTKEKKPYVDTTAAVASALKKHLIDDVPKIVTENFVESYLSAAFGQIKEIHKEVVKNPVSEYWEAAGFEGIAAGVEKLYEGESIGTALKYWTSTIAGAIAALLLGALGVLFVANVQFIQRSVQAAISKFFTGRETVLATSNSGRGIRPQDLNTVQGRAAAAGGGLANLTDPPNPTVLNPLFEKLGAVNRRILVFNNGVRKLPSARSLAKTAEGVEKVNTAIAAANAEKIELVAEKADKLVKALKDYDPKKVPDPKKIEKLNAAMAGANPTEVKAMATATGKLASAQRHFDPKKLPKARGLASAARSAERLADAGRDVAQAFNALKIKALEAAQAMA
ncbi:hypothetical protein ABZ567_06310 [Streptomyces sp. NPDC016459]|uniref:hypothetical protein n=1 Tax=Streptomyces sp. NPDC016459 TaxID=3157190 RepID=UPI0033F8ACA7